MIYFISYKFHNTYIKKEMQKEDNVNLISAPSFLVSIKYDKLIASTKALKKIMRHNLKGFSGLALYKSNKF